ncbi:WXG100 family type VII secretion target [Streptomyces sp. DW26H14]|uniref:WXG100 family type VII secretion target n=1 Tax=Streptomyces sp. DW26H14 TaxID=3435395 RepID=UPI00403DBE51
MSGHGGGRLIAAKTDFDSMSHEQMHALLQSADIHAAGNLSEKLAAIHKTVETIGNHLKAHVMGLTWEGKGGDAFREWGNQTANATLKLSAYADAASKQMNEVSQAIVEAHANMPDLSSTTGPQADLHKATQAMKHSDSPALDMTAIRANSRIEATRSDAAATMQKLATTYVDRGGQINALKPPTFPPPAMQLGDDWRQKFVARPPTSKQLVSSDNGESGASSFAHASNGVIAENATRHVSVTDGSEVGPPAHHVASQPLVAHTEIDSTAPPSAVPDTTTSSGASGGHSKLPQGVVPPAFGGQPATFTTRPIPRGLPRQSGVSSPRGRVPQTFGVEGPDDGKPSGRGLSRESGILGGRPVQGPNNRPPSRLPRGTVIGEEQEGNGTNGRSMTGRGMPGMHMGGEGAGRNGLVGGRRLASQAGGVVDPVPQSGKMGSRPFTEGGSGLVRDGGSGAEEGAGGAPGRFGRSGMPPHGTSRKRRQADNSERARPDYLVEEEETWQQGARRIVPPVIE